ncbi:MAG TPA: hypothetical protein VF469_39915 [Kofleriaceae bacterium]
MIRIGGAQLNYRGGDRSVARTTAISREALALVARRVPRSAAGHIARLSVEVRVPRNAADGTIAMRIADALARRL